LRNRQRRKDPPPPRRISNYETNPLGQQFFSSACHLPMCQSHQGSSANFRASLSAKSTLIAAARWSFWRNEPNSKGRRAAHSGLRVVYGRVRHARSEGGEGAAGGVNGIIVGIVFDLKSGCARTESAHPVLHDGALVSGRLSKGLVDTFPDRLGGFGCNLLSQRRQLVRLFR
jgi:hypothetical protein